MTKATKVPEPDGNHYHVEEPTGDRGQLVRQRAQGGRAAQPLPQPRRQARREGPSISTDGIRPLTAAGAVA
jgi:hypothetical protein